MKGTKIPLAKKVLLVGWDAADWKVINPLLDAGKMPHLERFVNDGVMGNVATLAPELSPMLWTSIATGKRSFKHGINGFAEPAPETGGIRPISVLSRKTKALWNILGQNGLRSNVVGWWPSHPAEPIHGVMVSNHYGRAHDTIDKPWPMLPGTVHPDRLTQNLADLRVHPQRLRTEDILPFVPRISEIDQDKDHRLETLAKIMAECCTIQAAATALMMMEPWDFMAVYFDSIDHFSHSFMQYHPPRREDVSEKDFEIYQGVVEAGYRFHDMMLGVLLRLAGPETAVILLSDHGFHSDHLRPRFVPHEPAGPAVQHRQYGILAMRGPGIRRDERIYGANLLDICPTVLAMLGLPVGQDMDGKPLAGAFVEPLSVHTIPSWDAVPGDDGRHSSETQIDPIEAQQAIDQLVALGYIEKPSEDREKAVSQTVRELNYNLARSYMDAGRQADAVPLLTDLVARWPDEYRFGIQLVQCRQAAGQRAEARKLLEELFARKAKNAAAAQEILQAFHGRYGRKKPDELTPKEQDELRGLISEASWNPFVMEYLMGSLLLGEGDEAGALRHLQKAEAADSKQPVLYLKIAEVYLNMKEWADVDRCSRKALALDPDNAWAHLLLAQSLLARRRFQEAAEASLTSVGLLYFNPLGHFVLGVALHRLRHITEAVDALRVAVSQNPNFSAAHRRLANIYKRHLGDEAQAAEHQRLAWEADSRLNAFHANQAVAATAVEPTVEDTIPAAVEAADQDDNSASRAAASDNKPVDLGKVITIVSGLPRSGTSMMMQMLQAGGLPALTDGDRPADDDNPRGYFEFTPARQLLKDTSWIPQAKGKVVKIVAQLLPKLPPDLHYRVLLMARDLEEVVASQHTMLQRQGKTGTDLSPARLRQVFSRQLEHVRRTLAVRRIPTLTVNHRDCINHPAEVAVAVNAFLGGILDESAMATSVDPTLYRHRGAGHEDRPSKQKAL